MNTQESALDGYKLSLARLAWAAVFLIWGTFTVYFFLYKFKNPGEVEGGNPILQGLIVLASLSSLAFAVFLFVKKSNIWMAILVSMMLITYIHPDGGTSFWQVWYNGWEAVDWNAGEMADLTELFSELQVIGTTQKFRFVSDLIFLLTFLTFPTGKWIFPRAWLILAAWTFVFAAESWLVRSDIIDWEPLLFIKDFLFLALAVLLQLLYYRRLPNSESRQQIKWILVFLFAILLAILLNLIGFHFVMRSIFDSAYDPAEPGVNPMLDLFVLSTDFLVPISNLGLVAAFAISTFRYRLWDTDLVINRTLVYGTLTGALSLLAIVSVTVADFFLKQWFGEDESSLWSVLVSAISVASVFNPLRDRLKTLIDRYFKPEELNFSGTFIEFDPAVRKSLTTRQIIELVITQTKKQLKVESAHVYLLQPDGRLRMEKNAHAPKSLPDLNPGEKLLLKLKDGKPVVNEDRAANFSLYVPLFIQRARIPDFIGVLALGRRLDNTGYPTHILNSLKDLGKEAGSAIHLSRI